VDPRLCRHVLTPECAFPLGKASHVDEHLPRAMVLRVDSPSRLSAIVAVQTVLRRHGRADIRELPTPFVDRHQEVTRVHHLRHGGGGFLNEALQLAFWCGPTAASQ
jgi:hypothetical protein